MIPFTKPMLAASLLKPNDPHTDESILEAMRGLRYPVLSSLKKDGIRAIRLDDLRSRTLNLIPNISIRIRSMKLPYGFDMELWAPHLSYDEVESIVMSESHERSDEIGFHVLDWCLAHDGLYQHSHYQSRCTKISTYLCDTAFVRPQDIGWRVPKMCYAAEELFGFFQSVETLEGEGICFRTPDSPYKQGRSTLKEQYLVKLARFVRTECTIIGFEEQMHNGNSVKRNAVGKMDRSSCQSKLIGKGTLGAFICKLESGIEVSVGTGVGLTDERRADIWLAREKYVGKQITIKHKPFGAKIKPRSPIFVGFRDSIDI